MADPEGFEAYVAARRDTLVRTAFLLTGDAHLAEDVVQTALVRVWPKWRRIARDGDVDAYVRRTLFTVFISTTRRRRWREVLTDPGSTEWSRPTVDDGSAGVDGRMQVEGFVRMLAPRQRAVIVLRYFMDLSEAETAAVLECSVGTVKSQTAKALRRLRMTARKEVVEP